MAENEVGPTGVRKKEEEEEQNTEVLRENEKCQIYFKETTPSSPYHNCLPPIRILSITHT
jgi:hypothetical protein